MKLRPVPFGQIAAGSKTIEARLYDDKRQLVRLGDEIQFTNTDTDERVLASVVGLLRYASFEAMFARQGVQPFGFTHDDDPQAAAEMMQQYYRHADELQHGVLGIQIELVA